MSLQPSGSRLSRSQGASTVPGQHDNLKALWVLSGFAEEIDPAELSTIICEAPDPETACRVITRHITVGSDMLREKWRKVISQTWLDYHRDVSTALTIPLSSLDVAGAPILQDTQALLVELLKSPANVEYERDGWSIAAQELDRLIAAIPSLKDVTTEGIEHEWNFIPLRRLRALLQAARLVRVYKGKLCVNQSRYERFRNLPLPQQYYILWHTDVYHVDWELFAGQWRSYVRVMQNYLPLVWEMTEDLEEGEACSAENIVQACIEAFTPLWEQEIETSETSLRNLYQRYGLPIAIEKLLVRDVLERYGIIKAQQPLDSLFSRLLRPEGDEAPALKITRAGEIILRAEREQDLPCAMDILR